MPVTDMNVMAEEISDTTVTENDSYQTEKNKIEENTETDSEQSAQNEALIEQESEEQKIISNGLLNYVGIDKPYLTSPDTQKIVVSYGDGTETISEAKIVYQKADGTILEDQMASRQEELFLFEHSFSNEDRGTYTLRQFVYVENGVEQTIELRDIGVEAMFGVDEEYPGYSAVVSDDEISSEEVEMSVVDMNANEVNTVQGDIETAIEDTADTIETTAGSSGKSISGNVVVVLDPGHGGKDPGTAHNGLVEKDLNLKIAQYCKNELKEYTGVTVYMTRETDILLGNDSSEDLWNRVAKAKAWGADLFVSIHINSGGGKGAEVWYPTENYNANIGKEGKEVAQEIIEELKKIGLSTHGNGGIYTKLADGSKYEYADGSSGDYYGIIRHSKNAGFPGIIVEHAFIDNESDAAQLRDESFLKQCGVADATGIAKYFGLSKGYWEQDGNCWKFNNGDGTYRTSQWLLLNSVWYYFDSKGIMQTGWTTVGDDTYYMDANGAMQTDWLLLGKTWYYLNASGAKLSDGWKWINGKYYYLDRDGRMLSNTWIGDYHVNASGEMQTGWIMLDNVWYYLNASGAKLSDGWNWINDKCYYFDKNGCMAANTWIGDSYVDASGAWVPGKQKVVPGWKMLFGKWKYLEQNGEYVKSKWLLLDNIWYHFDTSGYMQTGWLLLGNTWYYMESSGAMIAGRWQWVNGKCYYFDNNGYMAANTWIGDSYVDASGAWVPGKQRVVPGWKVVSGRWEYLEQNGEYVKSKWLLLNNIWYHFDSNGYMQTGWLLLGNTWYYMESSGAMIAGRWQWINGKCYYFDNNGYMAANTWIGDSYVDASGAWIPNKQKLTDIMGTSSVTGSQLANFYKSMNKTYPSYYAQNDKEAKTLEDFCNIYVEECKNEGVRVEVAFAQAMVETGYLSFGGDVDITQYNFAGMGATGNGVKGNSFSTVRLGIRAQVQHLKCYASTDKLNGDCVDPRWGEWLRGKAPYVEWLSIPNNPYGTGWAGSATYAEVIKGIMENINKYN